MPKFNLSILTPKGNVYENEVESLVAPGANGSFGVLANHASLLAATLPGVLKVKEENEIFFAVGTGMLEVSDGRVNFLVDVAEPAENSDEALNKLNSM